MDLSGLRNPVLEYRDWALKDACLAERDGWWYVFTSAFYENRGRVWSHVTGFRSRDLRAWSEPLFMWDGSADGWIGLCSPDLATDGKRWYLTYNSWGDKEGQPNALFYATSEDLETWEADIPLAAESSEGVRAIDAAVAFANGKCYLTWEAVQRPWMAVAPEIDGPWTALGEIAGPWQENAQFVLLDGRWCMVVQAHYDTGRSALRWMTGDAATDAGWLEWDEWQALALPTEEFSALQTAIAPALLDRRATDGFAYCLYAGTTERASNAHRGDCRLGLARSADLKEWTAAGEG